MGVGITEVETPEVVDQIIFDRVISSRYLERSKRWRERHGDEFRVCEQWNRILYRGRES